MEVRSVVSMRRYRWLLWFGVLLALAWAVIYQLLPWQQIDREVRRHQSELLQRLALTVEVLERQGRTTADMLSANLLRDPRLLALLADANSPDPDVVQDSRQQLLQRLNPLFSEMQAQDIRQLQLHDAEGNNVLRLPQSEIFGDSLLHSRRSLARLQRLQQPVSTYEVGRYSNGFRTLYPLFSGDRFLGSLEIGFSPAMLSQRIGASFAGASFYFLSHPPEQPISSTAFQPLKGVTDMHLDLAASSPDVDRLRGFLTRSPQHALQRQLDSLLPGVMHEGQQSLLILPVQNLAGGFSAAVLVLLPDIYQSQLGIFFDRQMAVALLVICILLAAFFWARYQRGRVDSAFRQLSLSLQGGQLQPWDYFPQQQRLCFTSELPNEFGDWQQRDDTDLHSWLSGLHPDDQQPVRRYLERQLRANESTLALEFRVPRGEEWRWLSANGRAMDITSQGQVKRFSGVYRDITAEKRMQLALEQSEQKYRAMFASNKAVELIIDPRTGEIVDANQAAVDYYRYPRRQLIGMKIGHINTLTQQEIAAEVAQAESEKRCHFNFQHRLASGEVRDVEVYSGPMVMADGQHYLYSIIHDTTERTRAQQELAESQARFDSLFNASIDGILMVDSQGLLEFWNSAAAQVLGSGTELNRGQPLPWARLQPEDLKWLRKQRVQAIRGVTLSPKGRLREFCLSQPDGEMRWLEVALSSFQQGECWHFVGVIRDVTERKQQEMALHQAGIAFENTMEGIIITDTRNRIVSVNRAVENISGYSREELIGKPPSTFSSGSHGDDFYQQMWSELLEKGHWQGEISNRHKGGQVYSEWLNINSVRDDAGEVCNYVAVFSDISDLKASRERLDYLAHHDLLTGLPNRLVFRERLEQGILRARRTEEPIAVLFIDLDRFKYINDNLGHDVGDELLQEVAQILSSEVRDSDTVVRLGGDEFSILMENFCDLDALASRAGKLVSSLTQPINTRSGHELKIGASIGIAVYPQDAPDATSLVKNADIAMYRAKELGKGRYEFYNQQMTDAARQRFNLEAALDRALEVDDQIQVYYQPQIDLIHGGVCGLEALVRWQHPEDGLIGPDRFIPLAEENGMIHRLGQRVADIALRDLQSLRELTLFDGIMAINISALQLESPAFADSMLALCQRYELVESIELEVTETGLGRHPEQFFAHLRKLRACGFKVAIDDLVPGTPHWYA